MVPSVADLNGCRLKLARANDHLKALHEEIEWFLKRDPQPLAFQQEPKTGENLLWSQVRENVPEEWSCIVGDVLYNLRSCLDHLVWQLVIFAGNTPNRHNAFPVFETDPMGPDGSARAVKAWHAQVRGMRPEDIALIARLQPHNRGKDFVKDPLWLLNELTNWDKHRELHLAVHGFTYSGFELSREMKTRAQVDITPFAPLDFRATGVPIIASQGKVQMKVQMSTDIAFRDGPWELEKVRETLVHLANFVTDVVNEFEPRFQ